MATTMRMDGLEALKARLRTVERADRSVVRIRVPLSQGARAAELYRIGEVLGRTEGEEFSELTVRLETWQVERLRSEGLEVWKPAPPAEHRLTG